MGYNPFRWYTSGKYRKRPLPQSSPLLLKIRNGDFESSPFFKEAKDARKEYQRIFDDYMQTDLISDIHEKRAEAHQRAKMKNVRALKLDEKAHEEEEVRLNQLKKELTAEFGQDLWEQAMEANIGGRGTTEDLYWWYKKQVGMGQTPSEMAIALGRKTTKGLQP